MPEDLILSAAVVLSKKKYTSEEEELIRKIGSPKAQIDVLIPDTMDASAFDMALSAVSKVMARATLQAQAMFPVLGRLLFVAQQNPELWNKKYDKFEDFRLSLAERFGVARQTSYDALEYAKRWAAVLPPADFQTVGRVKLKAISRYIGKGDEQKKTARDLLEFASDHTLDELDEHLDNKLHTGRGATKGAYIKFPCNKKQAKEAAKFYSDPRIQAAVGSDKWADIHDAMMAECMAEWIAKGEEALKEQETEPEPAPRTTELATAGE